MSLREITRPGTSEPGYHVYFRDSQLQGAVFAQTSTF